MMTSQEHKSFIEKIKACLRDKHEKDKKNTMLTCTLEEIFKGMSVDERNMYYQFNSPAYLNTTFSEAIKNNPKIHFDIGRKAFSFKHQFNSVGDLIEKLYQTRIGVIEGQDLYDDIAKEDLEKLTRDGLLRKITIKDRKSKPAITMIYSKNHSNDEVEKLNLENRTPLVLKEYWAQISKEEVDRMDINKRSAQAYLNRGQPVKKTEKRKSRRNREEDNAKEWRNYHLAHKIDEAKKMLTKRGPDNKKILRKTGGGTK